MKNISTLRFTLLTVIFPCLFVLSFVFAFVGNGWGQVTITNPSNTTPAMSATYTSLALAITDVNNRTAISGPVTITLDASTPQTAPAGGYSITNTAITGGSNTNRFIFDGGGNTITAPTPQTSGSLNDAIFKIIGPDFITIQNFTMQENASNTTTTAASNNMTEFGVALFYASTTNGAQNNIIQNNTITLKRTYSNTFGIYSNVRHTANAPTTAAEITLATGSNSGNKIYSNTISNVDYGIVFVGSNAAAAMDNGNDIGGSSASTANTITNWGGLVSGSISLYTGVTGNNVCIYMNHQINENVSFNTITSATNITTITTQGFLGILKSYTTTQPTGTITATYNNNTITLTNTGATTSQMTGMGLQSMTALSTATFNCNNNNIINCVNSGTTAAMIGMLHSSAPGTFNISGNTIRGFTSSVTGTGSVIGIQQQTNGVVTALNITNNKLGDATAGFVTFSGTANSSTVSGFVVTSTGAAATCALTITGNDIRGITHSNVGGGANLYISNAAASLSQNISSNTFTNLNVNTTGSVTFISNSVTVPAIGTQTISSNSIVTAFNKTGASGTITLCTSSAASVAGAAINHNSNNFSNITVTGSTIIAGWISTDGGTANKTYSGNTFNNWTGGSGTLTGMSIDYGGGNGGNGNVLSNNTVTNITGTGIITGINLGSSGTTHTANNNTITGLSSTGTGGSVSGIASAAPTGNIYSNIINNLSSTSTTATVAGISSSGATANIYQNTINTLSCVGTTSGVTNGIMVTGGTTVNVYRNKIYDLSTTGAFSTTPGVNGIVLSAGTTVNTYNNLIGDLKAASATSTNAIRGISITSTTTTSTNKVYNNTVYLTGSGGTNFGTSGIYHAASAISTTANLDLQNNMIFNTCTPSGTGIVTAYRRSSGVVSMLANYASASNKNLFYAGTPGASNLIYSDGTSSAQTLAAYQAGVFTAGTVATRDANSFTESAFTPSTYFVSTTGSNANYLQPASGIMTQAEGGGNTITMCSPDFNGVTRPGFSGAAYDVGAWEFAGVSPVPVITLTSVTPGTTAQCTKSDRVVLASITTPGTISTATLNYSHNGTAQTPIAMTNTSGSAWTGTMLAPTVGNATVTWAIVATNSIGISTTFNGTSFADEPTTGVTATATATPSTICSGSPTSLNLSTTGSGPVDVGTATTLTTATSQPTAFCNRWAGHRSQVIFTAAELSALGLSAGNISSMAYNITTLGDAATNANFTVLIGNTSLSTFTGATFESTTGFTTCFPAATYTHTASGWQTINFTTPFNWNGTSNIIVDVRMDGANATNNSITYFTATPGNTVLYTTISLTTTVTLSTTRLNVRFTNQAPTPTAYSWSDGSSTIGTSNPQSATVSSTTTYTCTATVNGCPMTAAVTPTVNPLPTAPTGTPSSQCPGIPTASVADNNGYTTPTFKWYSAATGGTLLQTSTSATYLTSISATTTFYVAVVGTNTCESARTAVTVTISQPDAISASASVAAICLGQSVTLTAANTATTPTQTYSYSWACATTGSGATSANTNNPASVTPTAAGSYTYTVTATDGGCSVVNTVAVTVNVLPSGVSISSSTICIGGVATISYSPSSTITVQVGNGSTNSAAATTPYRQGINTTQARVQYLVTQAELNAAGIVGPTMITSLGFNVVTAGTGAMPSFIISLAQSSLTALTSTYVSNGFTTVYSATNLLPVAGINTHGFQTYFPWDGNSNIVVNICHTGSNGTTAAVSVSTLANVSTASGAASGQCSEATALATDVKRPNIYFGTNNSSTITWTPTTPTNTLYNDAAATIAYTGSSATTVYAKPTTTTTYTATATSAAGCSTTASVTINVAAPTQQTVASTDYIWKGTTSTAWGTLSNWTQYDGTTYTTPTGAPSSTSVVVIPQNNACVQNQPIIGASAISMQDLKIESGATTTLNSGAQLTVTGTLTNNGTLTIESGATFVQGPSSTITSGTTGTYNVKQTVTGAGGATATGRFWYMGVPLNSLTRGAAFGNDGADNRLWSWSESSQAWSTPISNATTPLTPTTGYVFRTGATSTTLNFSGTSLYSADASITGLTNSAGSFDGCHLMSNPYTAYLDWESVIAAAGTTNLSSTYCVRSYNTGSTTMVYDTYNATGDFAVNPSGVAMTRYIAPMQAFWIVVNPTTTGSISMTKSMLSHQSGAVGLKEITSFPAFARLNLVDGDFIDQVVVYTDPNAKNKIDNYDSKKFLLPNKPQVYTTVGDEQLVINGLKSGMAKTIVPLTVELPNAQVYTFEMNESYVENGSVILEDTQEGVFQDMGIHTTYQFSGDAGVTANRFVLHFLLPTGNTSDSEDSQVGINDLTNAQIDVINNQQGSILVSISSDLQASGEIQILDAAGSLIQSKTISDHTTALAIKQGAGIYFVRVITPLKSEMKKIFIY